MTTGYKPTWQHQLPSNIINGFGAPHVDSEHICGVGTLGAAARFISRLGSLTRPARPAAPVRVKAGGNAADVVGGTGAQIVVVRYVSTSFQVVSEPLLLAGASASSPTTQDVFALLSATVASVGSGEENAGDIVIESTAPADVAKIPAGEGVSGDSVIWVPSGYLGMLRNVHCGAENKSAFRVWTQSFLLSGGTIVPGPRLNTGWLTGVNPGRDFLAAMPLPQQTLLWVDGLDASGGDASVHADVDIFELTDAQV